MDDGMSGFCLKPRGGGGGCGNKCGRWNPTTEQVRVLTDLFRSGLRTPSTDQIQKISSQLSFYGKIESKNVFYWFQNHKARERQKRRRVSVADHQQHHEIHYREEHKVSSTKYFGEVNQVVEPERVIETLELFPLNSFNECKELANPCFSYNIGIGANYQFRDHPPLDLRLSFL
ncbi:hypothetical protein RHSIM_Rhsim03G0141000 [Rhododendron simsii]|uniref:Protein WUSCHEL n=1 Tax=Rhododendron simsii TaxID=118357 RepID=A0A834H809_RHOSS|nr:hypothetical protein RHSIM_Rhsim03G0141000 [Rhododendron simsii]